MDLKKLREYKRRQFESGDFGDCSLIVKTDANDQSPKKFCAIKTILQIASPIFDTLLRESDKGTFTIENCDATAFQTLLNFIHWEEIDLKEVEEAFSLIELSRKYEILDLETICEAFLEKSCVSSNACLILERSKQLAMQGLVEKALNVIKTDTKEVFVSRGLLDSKIGTLICILEQDTLSIDSEMEAFEMVSRYATHNGLTIDSVSPLDANKNEKGGTLTDVMKQIRFLSMKPKEFALKPLLSNLLTAEQKTAIIGKLLLPSDAFQAFPVGFSLKGGRIHYKK